VKRKILALVQLLRIWGECERGCDIYGEKKAGVAWKARRAGWFSAGAWLRRFSAFAI